MYTGSGEGDQEFVRGNAALLKSFETHAPVRVVRGAQARGPLSPALGYRYDGLYEVVRCERVRSAASGRVVVQAELRRVPGQPPLPAPLTAEQLAERAAKSPKPWKRPSAAAAASSLSSLGETLPRFRRRLRSADDATVVVASLDAAAEAKPLWPEWARGLFTWELFEQADLLKLVKKHEWCPLCWAPLRIPAISDPEMRLSIADEERRRLFVAADHLEKHLPQLEQRSVIAAQEEAVE